jgi:hypothetical protein
MDPLHPAATQFSLSSLFVVMAAPPFPQVL